MKKNRKEKKIGPRSEIKETCVSGVCEGMCKQLYYKICTAHEPFYIDYSERKPKIVYVNDKKREEYYD